MAVVTGLLGVIAAIAGWFLTEFLARPIRKFWDLRGDVSLALDEYSRFVPGSPDTDLLFWRATSVGTIFPGGVKIANPRRDDAVNEFRRLGLLLKSFGANEFFANNFLSHFKIDVREAGGLLIKLAAGIDEHNSSSVPQRAAILHALRLAR